MPGSRHKRAYPMGSDRSKIPKFQIKSGMIVEFVYKTENKPSSKPLVFVMDTDEHVAQKKKSFSGINLNYLPFSEVEKFFIKILSKAGWEIDRLTGLPKVDIWEEEDTGVKPIGMYKSFIKGALLTKYDCWRTYKYSKINSPYQIKYHFQTYPLSEIYSDDKMNKVLGEMLGEGNKKDLKKVDSKTLAITIKNALAVSNKRIKVLSKVTIQKMNEFLARIGIREPLKMKVPKPETSPSKVPKVKIPKIKIPKIKNPKIKINKK